MQFSVSHDPSEIIVICSINIINYQTFLLDFLINIKNNLFKTWLTIKAQKSCLINFNFMCIYILFFF